MKMSIWLSSAVLASLLCACSEELPPKTPAQPPPVAKAPEPSPPAVAEIPERSQVRISKEIREACGIDAPNAYFEFDSTALEPEARSILRKLADCFRIGKLEGERMTLVGHADPRGDFEYNMLLGGRRANSVTEAIAAEGLAPDRMLSSSRGEMDATGTDERTWALDRRVDIALAQSE